MLIMKSGKQQMTERIELLNQGKINVREKKTYKYLGILKVNAIKAKMNEKKL